MGKVCPFIKICPYHSALKRLAGDNIICYNNYTLCKFYKMMMIKRKLQVVRPNEANA